MMFSCWPRRAGGTGAGVPQAAAGGNKHCQFVCPGHSTNRRLRAASSRSMSIVLALGHLHRWGQPAEGANKEYRQLEYDKPEGASQLDLASLYVEHAN